MASSGDVGRVIGSVVDVLKRQGWEVVGVNKSNRSISRYVRARRGHRNITVRVSDHRYRGNSRCDYDFHPNWYNERHFGRLMARKKTRFRAAKR